MFHKIDMETWERKEYYHYYINFIKSKYNLNVDMDITKLLKLVKEKKLKFYPTIIYAVMRGINKNREFRMSYDKEGNLGYWDYCNPSYTIFHEDDKTFSDIWSEYSEDFSIFYSNVINDMEKYKDVKGIKGKPRRGDNFFPVSSIPWLSFTGYSNDTYSESNMLFPVTVFGKYYERDGKILLPFSVFATHAVADGYHTCKLINDIQEIVLDVENWLNM
ncbi:chloramphenicol O-acetyltransferase type A [Fusobacterium sp. PH5-7]|uniref:chloramphenicol acetyltransferase n=1 Tax=Fusobacterium sp. PH5-7 TaxID=2940528 RepID=UPI0024764AB1|nr:chloramphenicol acetyltransferase [Fusobacterium sp. PH5-7]MDH6458738.1 chloramphenicol O-acetyltransferase type A [Fusobacterium sp. PH5-7]